MGTKGFSRSAKAGGDSRFEPLRFLRRFERQTPAHAFEAETPAQWRRWRDALRQSLADAIGLTGFAPRAPRVEAGPVTRDKGYARHALTIETAPGLWVPAFLLVPRDTDEPRPAIICCHGHGYGMNALVGLSEDGRSRRQGVGYQHDFALQAVRAGFVALAYDQCGFGRRRDSAFNHKWGIASGCEQPCKNGLHFGLSMTGIRVWDALRMVDVLAGRKEVLGDHIGIAGISGGGLVAQFAAALDDRLAAACISGYCNRFADCILSIHHCIDNYMPGLGLLADNDDVACLIAPRPLLIQSGAKDPIFPITATRAALRKLQRCYKLLNAGAALDRDLFDGGHEFRGTQVWPFFARHLGLQR